MPEEYGDLNHVVPVPSDSPDVPKAFRDYDDTITAEMADFPVDQLQVPGGAGDKGKLLIVDGTGAAAFQAMKGDATIAEDGTLSIGEQKILTAMLQNLGVTTAKMANESVTLAKMAKALGLPESYLAAAVQTKLNNERVPVDGSATSRKMKPTVVAEAGSGDMNIRETEGVVPGTEAEISVAVKSLLLVMATFDFKVVDTHEPVDIGECYGTFRVNGAAGARTARFTADMSAAATQFRGSVALTEVRELTTGTHTLQLHAKGTAYSLSVDDMRCMAAGTGYTALLVAA